MAPSDRGEGQYVPLLIGFLASWLKPYVLLCLVIITLESEWPKSLMEGRTRVYFLKYRSSYSLSGNWNFCVAKGKMPYCFIMKLAYGLLF